jgi:magnesium chelatase family protein
MLARVHSCAVIGIDGVPLSVEVDQRPGTFKVDIVGLPDPAVKESRERVVAAIRNAGFRTPRGYVVVNLARGYS